MCLPAVVALFLLTSACSEELDASRSSGIDESKPPLSPDGPLLGLAIVAEQSREGFFTDPQLTFVTDDTEATAVVGLGTDVPEDASLTVAWYRFTGPAGRKHLFSHKITAGPGGIAFSQGVADRGFAPGTYETVATLADHQVRTPWFVREGTMPAVVGGGGAGPSALVFQVSSQESPSEPSSGASGYIPDGLGVDEPATMVPAPVAPDSCEIRGIDASIFGFLLSATADWAGPCQPVTLAASMSGSLQTLRTGEDLVFGGFGSTSTNADNNICNLPGGSDLPGGVVRVVATGSEGARRADTITLPDSEALGVGFERTNPPAGSAVKGGDRIALEALAARMPPTFGVESLKLYADGEQFESVGNLSGTQEPIPCDDGKNFAHVDTQYTVPGDPPAVVEICAEATGFDFVQARECIEFYTGEVWKGTFTYDYSGPGLTCSASYSVTLAALEGEVSGDITQEGSSCPGTSPGSPVTGTKTDNAFSLNASSLGGEFEVPITGENQASATFSSTPEEIRRFNVRCVSCES